MFIRLIRLLFPSRVASRPIPLPPPSPDYTDPPPPSRDELGRMVWQVGRQYGRSFDHLDEDEREHFRRIGERLFLAGRSYELTCVRERLEAMQRQ